MRRLVRYRCIVCCCTVSLIDGVILDREYTWITRYFWCILSPGQSLRLKSSLNSRE